MYNPLPATGALAAAALFGILGLAVALITIGYMLYAGKTVLPAGMQRKLNSKRKHNS